MSSCALKLEQNLILQGLRTKVITKSNFTRNGQNMKIFRVILGW